MTSRFETRNGVMVDLTTGLPPTEAQHKAGDAAHDGVLAAESAFELALRRKYKSRACEMRYQTRELPSEIRALALAYQAAVEVWRATWLLDAMPAGVTK